MRKATKTILSLAVVLIAGLNIIVPAFAQDPFTAIAVGGLTGASGAGLFSSMAGMSGVNISWGNNTSDPMDAMWNVLNPDHVYFSGEKHEATMIDEDIYDYIDVDIGNWLDGQSDFIVKMINELDIEDDDSGQVSVNPSIHGIEFVNGWAGPFAVYPSDRYTPFDLTVGPYRIVGNGLLFDYYFNDVKIGSASSSVYMGRDLYLRYVNGYVAWGQKYNYNQYANLEQVTLDPATTVDWTSEEVDSHVFDGWESARVKIPHSISGLSANWDIPEFLGAINTLWENHQQGQVVIEDTDQPIPPPPLPDTPLGEVPFDDWVDLWGQSIWDQLTRLEEKQELMVINQESGLDSLDDLQGLGEDLIEDVDDLIGLETDINENLQDVITYEQGISEDVEDIGENVEDIEDEVIIIVDEMGNVIDVLEGIDAKIYAQGQTIGSISTEVGTVADVAEAIQTEVETQTETLEDTKEAVEDMVPYVMPLPDIATDTETMVDILPDIATATQTSTQTLTDTLPDIKDATETITETLPDIITEIQDATTTLTDTIPNIDDICLNIDEAPYKDIETGVDRLPRFLLPFITDLRSALGIWHYVTEWLAQISTTFAFISGCLVGTSIMTPIYAAIAGFMCIKVYRRMTS